MAQKSLMEKFEDYFCLFSEYKQIDQTIIEFLKLSELDIRTIEKIMTKNKLVHRLVCDREVSNSVLLYEIMYSVLSYLGSNPKKGDIKSFGKDLYWVPDINLGTYGSLSLCISDAMLKYLKGMVTNAVGSTIYMNTDIRPVNMKPEGRCVGYMDIILSRDKKFCFENETDEIKYEIEVCKKYGKMLEIIS